jgi:hypothetical protein
MKLYPQNRGLNQCKVFSLFQFSKDPNRPYYHTLYGDILSRSIYQAGFFVVIDKNVCNTLLKLYGY